MLGSVHSLLDITEEVPGSAYRGGNKNTLEGL